MSLEHNGTSVHFEVFGENNQKTLFFFHGWGCNGEIFKQIVTDLKVFYKCIVITFPPFGKSGVPNQAWQIEDYSEIVHKVKNELKIKEFGIICHSFGARVAIKFSSCYNKVSALVITGGAGMRPRRGIKYYFKVWFYKIFKRFLNSKKHGSADFRKLGGNMRKTFVNIVNTNQKNQAKKVTAPTLLIYGNKDNQTPLYMAKKFNKLIKNSQLKIYKNVGHFAFIEKREMFFSDVFEFLKKHY